VNLDKEYLFVKKHEVNLRDLNNNKDYTVIEDKPFDIKTFDFIALEKFIIDFQDKTWETINKSLDKNFYESLKKSLNQSL
jgi:predicted membrane-bound spermidine synthase